MFFEIGILMIFIVSSIEDIRKKEVLLWEIVACAGVSLAEGMMDLHSGSLSLWEPALSLIPGLVMLILSVVTRQGIGPGDGLLVLAAGPALGLSGTITSLAAAFCISGLFSGILLLTKKAGKKTKIPFVPFMAVGTLAMMLLEGFG